MQTQEQRQPHQYAKRILVVVSGMSPQILTETLYALTQRQQPAFVPTEVHLVSTTSGARHARLTLLEGDAQFYCLCNDYGLDPAIFTAANIHTIRDALGNPLDDIRTPADNEAAADFITGFIRKQTANLESAVHVSMAGGRKTMGYYAGYGLSLYGRPQDRLSHVLVSEGFEGHPEFYYPTPASKIIESIRDKEKSALDTREAEVDLAEIPFVRMREELPEKHSLLSGRHSFCGVINAAERGRELQKIRIDLENMEFTCNGEKLALEGANLIFLCWVAWRQHLGLSFIPTGKAFNGDVEKLRKEFSKFCHDLEAHESSLNLNEDRLKMIGKVSRGTKGFGSNFSRLRSELISLLGRSAAEQLAPRNIGVKNESRFGLVDFERHYEVIEPKSWCE
ncbi:TIGR02584 family CRISPR-associated protein [Lysobacteraceae bacterium NML03-0222]|nr:TIGR02584 family CRISPR-associated protein [Xanthomonadaceae bacterium NML03-0222]